MIKQIRAALAGAALLLVSFQASALPMSETYYFTNIVPNTPPAGDLSGQLSMTVWNWEAANAAYNLGLDSTDILFTFQNNVGIASNIAEIFFDDGLLGPSVAYNSLGGFTDFTAGLSGNFPEGSDLDPDFEVTEGYTADVNPGNPNLGINTSADILGLGFGLTLPGGYTTYEQTIAGIASKELRIGLHVRSISPTGGSDSYINNPDPGPPPIDPEPNPLPVPGTLLLLGIGLLGLARTRRRS